MKGIYIPYKPKPQTNGVLFIMRTQPNTLHTSNSLLRTTNGKTEVVKTFETEKNQNEEFNKYWDLVDVVMAEEGHGDTGYIDSLLTSDLTAPIEKFVDSTGRKAIAVKVKFSRNGKMEDAVVCFHYRNDDCGGPVVAAGYGSPCFREVDECLKALMTVGTWEHLTVS